MEKKVGLIVAWVFGYLCTTSAFAALTVADLPTAGGVLQDKTIYMVKKNKYLTGVNSSALVVASNAEVVIYISAGVSLTCNGADASSHLNPGQPGILLPKGSTLYVTGAGYLTASGGCAGNGEDGTVGGRAFLEGSYPNRSMTMYGGIGGEGGNGGAGAGAGIGTSGGKGGNGGGPGGQVHGVCGYVPEGFTYGSRGEDGNSGASSADVGDVYILGSVSACSFAGKAGAAGAGGSKQDQGSYVYFTVSSGGTKYVTGGDGGGGGGGAGGDGGLYSWITKRQPK